MLTQVIDVGNPQRPELATGLPHPFFIAMTALELSLPVGVFVLLRGLAKIAR